MYRIQGPIIIIPLKCIVLQSDHELLLCFKLYKGTLALNSVRIDHRSMVNIKKSLTLGFISSNFLIPMDITK